ncbi:hypothetical protein JTE90_001497 [Oedothorax gibbosus]|uniref:Uncharacterized protein n=1 Tax=Oedothorax gibbosus TaxID=931172 RepID=A0AAV6UM88_9ARAC|nr:hypothetical protein JTE90_001497 [Oedothorax gibbosus]
MELWFYFGALLVFVMSSVKGEIRCYCNQAPCVSTGYMCKSSALCFSDFESGLHGCAEKKCPRGEAAHCCADDMCNYAHVDMRLRNPPVTGALEDNEDDSTGRTALLDASIRREVWFRAAVIATPVAGACVLALLAAAAARVLRQDARRLRDLRRVCGPHDAFLLPPHTWNYKGGKGATVV